MPTNVSQLRPQANESVENVHLACLRVVVEIPHGMVLVGDLRRQPLVDSGEQDKLLDPRTRPFWSAGIAVPGLAQLQLLESGALNALPGGQCLRPGMAGFLTSAWCLQPGTAGRWCAVSQVARDKFVVEMFPTVGFPAVGDKQPKKADVIIDAIVDRAPALPPALMNSTRHKTKGDTSCKPPTHCQV
ncbi:hypothetical protein CSAL01_01039 [Colletotrichum salicis]|uniref:Uncharacterized protein n=1 Tax=Colletotrichum salicis TaxID=1209931 RepID=A0A135V5E4_9PEZI|nr:hypothetical protein CSAL01_01039 [Colletotrichum salicis]